MRPVLQTGREFGRDGNDDSDRRQQYPDLFPGRLRAVGAYSNGNCDRNRYSYGDCDEYGHGNRYGHQHGHCHGYCDWYGEPDCDRHSDLDEHCDSNLDRDCDRHSRSELWSLRDLGREQVQSERPTESRARLYLVF